MSTMRAALLTIGLGLALTAPALADDEFGARFSGEAPAALEPQAPPEQTLVDAINARDAQAVEPAAGGDEAAAEAPEYIAVPMTSEVGEEEDPSNEGIETKF